MDFLSPTARAWKWQGHSAVMDRKWRGSETPSAWGGITANSPFGPSLPPQGDVSME